MNAERTEACRAVVIGGSAGAAEILAPLLGNLPHDYRIPIFVCRHLHLEDDGGFARYLAAAAAVKVVEAADKMVVCPHTIYTAPAGYHLLIERDETLALSVDEKVRFSRPSIDVLFESAAYVYSDALVGILLSGANNDGTFGMQVIRAYGGFAIAQTEESALHPLMPKSAADAGAASLVLSPDEIGRYLLQLG